MGALDVERVFLFTATKVRVDTVMALSGKKMTMKGPAQKGFTLIELLVALTVMGILIVVAMPSFSARTLDKRITTQTNDFISALMLAGSESPLGK